MKDKSIYIILVVVLVGVIALATGFERVPNSENPWLRRLEINVSAPGAPGSRHSTIEADGAEQAEVTVKQAVGKLDITAGGTSLMDAEFDTTQSGWIPAVTYAVEGTSGVLSVVQPESTDWVGTSSRNNWDIELSPALPLDLFVERGVGEGDIDLHELDVRSLKAILGVGDTSIDLTGPRSNDMRVDIEGGLGRTQLVIPAAVGVRIFAEKGIGEISMPGGNTMSGDYWTNEAYGADGPKIEIRITQGIGEVDVEME